MKKNSVIGIGLLAGALLYSSDVKAWNPFSPQPKPAVQQTQPPKVEETKKPETVVKEPTKSPKQSTRIISKDSKESNKVNLIARLKDDPTTAHHEGSLHLVYDKDTDSYKVEVALDSNGQLCVEKNLGTIYDNKCFNPSELEVLVDDISGDRYNVNRGFYNVGELGIPVEWIKDGKYSIQLWLKNRRTENGKTVADQLASLTSGVKIKEKPTETGYHLRISTGENLEEITNIDPNKERSLTAELKREYFAELDLQDGEIKGVRAVKSKLTKGDLTGRIRKVGKNGLAIDLTDEKLSPGIYGIDVDVAGQGVRETERLWITVRAPEQYTGPITPTVPTTVAPAPEDQTPKVEPDKNDYDILPIRVNPGKNSEELLKLQVERRSNGEPTEYSRLEDLLEPNQILRLKVDGPNEMITDYEWTFRQGQNPPIKNSSDLQLLTPDTIDKKNGLTFKPVTPGEYTVNLKIKDEEREERKSISFKVKPKLELLTNPDISNMPERRLMEPTVVEPRRAEPQEPAWKAETWNYGVTAFGTLQNSDFDLNAGGMTTFAGHSLGARGFGSWNPTEDVLSIPLYAQFVRTDFDLEGDKVSGDASQNSFEVGTGIRYQDAEKRRATLTVGLALRESVVNMEADGANLTSDESVKGTRITAETTLPKVFGDHAGLDVRLDVEAAGVQQTTKVSFTDFAANQTTEEDLGARINLRGYTGLRLNFPMVEALGLGAIGYSQDIAVAHGVEDGAQSVRGLGARAYVQPDFDLGGVTTKVDGEYGLVGGFRKSAIGFKAVYADTVAFGVEYQRTNTAIAPNKPHAEARANRTDDRLLLTLGLEKNWDDILTDRSDDDF